MNFEINISVLPEVEELKFLFSQTSWASKREDHDIEKMLNNLSVFVSIRDNSVLIGFGRAITDGIYRALIDDIIVDHTHQGKGIGRIIVESLLDQLEGVEEIFLNTKPELEDFYKRFGFSKIKIITMKK